LSILTLVAIVVASMKIIDPPFALSRKVPEIELVPFTVKLLEVVNKVLDAFNVKLLMLTVASAVTL
jgi:hypothetical protein